MSSIINHKKPGLAKLAKAHSLSNSLNNLGLDLVQEEKRIDGLSKKDIQRLPSQDRISPNTHQKLAPSNSAGSIHSVRYIHTKRFGTEDKMDNLHSLSSYLPLHRERRCSNPSDMGHSSPDVCLSTLAKEAYDRGSILKNNFVQSLNRKSLRKTKSKNETSEPLETSRGSSPTQSHLQVPKRVSRSRSLSRLSDAFSQLQNMCVVVPSKSGTDSEAKNRSGKKTCDALKQIEPFYIGGDCSDDTTDSEYAENENLFDSSWRSSSLSQLSNVAPLCQIKLSEVKHRTYLFGGLGSLLGTHELDRYFPDRNIVIFIATWNMNGKEPPDSLDDFLLPDDIDHMPDMYVIGTQESGGDRTEWEVRLQTTIGPSHVLFHSAILGILHLTVFIRRDLVWFCSVPEEAYHSLRPGTYFKTKGAIAISFQFFGTKIIFINTHLFAHEEKLVQRIQNYKNIITNLDVPRNLKKEHMYRSKDVTKRYDIVFWMGDLNFRLVGPRDEILEKIATCSKTGEDLSDLLYFDQLSQSKHKGEIFEDFSEGPISFPPTFKFDVGTNHYDTSTKQRVPSYTDRILYKSKRDPIRCRNYGTCPHFKSSDHKPVWGVFTFKVRPGKDDVPLAAGLFQREVYLTALKRRRRFFHQPSSRNCQMQ